MRTRDEIDNIDIAWPSYVDFLSTFVFVLMVLIGSLLYLVSGDADQRALESQVTPLQRMLAADGYNSVLQGTRFEISLKGKVSFETGRSELTPSDKTTLRTFAQQLIANQPNVNRIIVRGHADRQTFVADPFGNWRLSTDRALAVLQFLYYCDDCNFSNDVRTKLTLSGQGDIDAEGDILLEDPNERRVDIILDFGAAKNNGIH